MRVSILAILLALTATLFASPSLADRIPETHPEFPNAIYPYFAPPNECGSTDLSGPLVPEFFGVFSDACNAHDLCYNRLGSDRGSCDAAFLEDLHRACRALGDLNPLQPPCHAAAWSYAAAVRDQGNEPFEAAQRQAARYIAFVRGVVQRQFLFFSGFELSDSETDRYLGLLLENPWSTLVEDMIARYGSQIVAYQFELFTGGPIPDGATEPYTRVLEKYGLSGLRKEFVSKEAERIIDRMAKEMLGRSLNQIEMYHCLSLVATDTTFERVVKFLETRAQQEPQQK